MASNGAITVWAGALRARWEECEETRGGRGGTEAGDVTAPAVGGWRRPDFLVGLGRSENIDDRHHVGLYFYDLLIEEALIIANRISSGSS